jgi:CMP-N-acetylneuraminic acid synthetase
VAKDASTRKELVDNVASTYDLLAAKSHSITTRNTMLMAMAPTSPSKVKQKDVKQIWQVFKVKQNQKTFAVQLHQVAVAKKHLLDGTSKKFLQQYHVKGHSCFSPDFNHEFHGGCLNVALSLSHH